MKKHKSLAQRNKVISRKLFDSMFLLEILNGLIDGSVKESIMLRIISDNIRFSFKEIEKCRKQICGLSDN